MVTSVFPGGGRFSLWATRGWHWAENQEPVEWWDVSTVPVNGLSVCKSIVLVENEVQSAKEKCPMSVGLLCHLVGWYDKGSKPKRTTKRRSDEVDEANEAKGSCRQCEIRRRSRINASHPPRPYYRTPCHFSQEGATGIQANFHVRRLPPALSGPLTWQECGIYFPDARDSHELIINHDLRRLVIVYPASVDPRKLWACTFERHNYRVCCFIRMELCFVINIIILELNRPSPSRRRALMHARLLRTY